MYVMNYSSNVRGLVDPGQEIYDSDVKQIMLDAKLPNGSYVQMRDIDGEVFRLVVQSGDIKQIFPKWNV